ncbi:tyrosine-type recombinase/integrase [Nocardia brasiliensis]|uniref:Tyrosine-type recombinase/integrase n=1 Tax=Nocardia brasiliensis TaxID=37326 RepID=A0A6G9XM52_NOCBR|nr:site-specific integrase [Nocardia brasiliensis]QIS01940.1 tyrosine-type recombinase/integrase [Nocardia brasiliensis]
MATRRNPRSGIEDRWWPTVVETDPVTGAKSKKKVKSEERFGKGKRWRARYVDPNGVERSQSFDTKVQAQRWIDSEVTTKVVTGTWVDPDRSGVLFSVVAEKWYETKKFRKPKTVAGYRSLLDTVVLRRWGSVPLRDIDFEDIQEWVVLLSESGSTRFKGKGLSASRVIQSYQVFSQVLRFAVKSKRLVSNPAVDIELPSTLAGERPYLTHLEVMRLGLAAGRLRPLVFTLAYTGIRIGEASALRVMDVDVANRRIRVSRSATAVTGQGTVVTDTKNHTARTVPIPATLAKDLEKLTEGSESSAPLFPSEKDGGILEYNEFRRAFNEAANSAGLKGLIPHGLRHTAASLAISAGANIKVVQRMLGHKTATLTLDLYGHLFPDDLDIVADGMEAGAQAAADELRTA